MTMTAPFATSDEPDILDGYFTRPGDPFDEMIDASGAVRPHWQQFLGGLRSQQPEERASRASRIDRRVRDTGIAYDIFADPRRSSQRWHLDLTPLILSKEDWRLLQSGLNQRARLFDAILRDVYGEQALLREGLIPPELVFSDSFYLNACRDVLPRAGALQFYAADLARGSDGSWRLIDSHTETLAGIGFAIANRVVHTHVTGDLFKQCNAVRLAAYFQRLQAALIGQSGRDDARIAVLTPGPHHEDYFSHAYLARYLGYLLVEGIDLRTKGGKVYLKTLDGLKEIDLILRCVDGRSADPLELDPAGFDGPAGLMRVCRKTPGLAVNPIGAAFAQNRALGPYLAGIAKHVLGEDLVLPDAPRWWLGSAAGRRKILDDPDGLVIRKAQEGTGRPGNAAPGHDPRIHDADDRALLEQELMLHGSQLVAEQKLTFATAPLFDGRVMRPRPFALRLYVSKTPAGYETMPGGLAMSVDPDAAVALSAPEGQTRDVWVLSDAEQAPHISLWRPAIESARVQRSQRVIQSRVADDLFWLGRYSERADWTMRVIRAALRRVEEDGGPATGQAAAQQCLENLLGKDELEKFRKRSVPADAAIEEICLHLVRSPKGTRTLERTFASLYRVGNLARDRLSFDCWRTLGVFRPGDTWRDLLSAATPVAVLDLLEEGLTAIAAFNGLMHENMTRNYGWSFLDMGRRLERAYNLSEAILSLFAPPPAQGLDGETSNLQLVLELADSFITYRSRYRLDPLLHLVLDLLLADETNPRSIAFQMAALSKHMDTLPDARPGASLSEDRRLILALLTAIRLGDAERLAGETDRAGLKSLLEQHVSQLPALSTALGRHYFNLTEDAPHRVHTRVEPKP